MNKQIFVCFSLNGILKSDVFDYSKKIDSLIGFMALRSTIAMMNGIEKPEEITIVNFFRLS